MLRRYWDSCCFLSHLMGEDETGGCRMILGDAQAGKLQIVTSSLTIAEVLWLRRKTRIPKENAEIVEAFFRHEWILVRELDRQVAEEARALVWDHDVPAKDAVHLATALNVHAVTPLEQLDTFDNDDLTPLSGKFGDPPLMIGPPWIDGRLL